MISQRFIVQNSGGVTSWAAARRLVDEHGPDAVLLLTAMTNSEAPDWLTFVQACHADLGCEMVLLDNDGRTIWDVFHASRFLGNSRVDVCSRVLKREPLRAWLEANCDPDHHRVVIGYDWDETHRIAKADRYWAPWTVLYPMAQAPYVTKSQMLQELEQRGLPMPALYGQGFSHNNCNGACVKAGQAQWAHLLKVNRDAYLTAETEEARLSQALGTPVTILVDRRNLKPGEKRRPLSLGAFRYRIEGNPSDHDGDWGACSCMDESGSND